MKNTALLVMDYQNDIVGMTGAQAPKLLANAKSLLQAARKAGAFIAFVQVVFRPGYPEVSPNNKAFAGLKQSNRMVLGSTGAAIHAEVAPLENEPIVIKHRVGALNGTDMQTLLRAHDINHIVMAGISTSGVILSTLRLAADLDYKITVASDACADTDEQVHQVLMEKVFPRQADVVSTQEAVKLFK